MKTSTKGTIAQLLICVLLLPFLCVILKLFFPDNPTEYFISLIKEISVTEIWFELLTNFKDLNLLSVELEKMEKETPFYLYYSIYQIYAIGIITGIFKVLSEKLGMRGIPIVPTVLSVLITCLIQKYTGENIVSLLFQSLTLFVIYIVIVFLISKVSAVKKIITVLVQFYFKLMLLWQQRLM